MDIKEIFFRIFFWGRQRWLLMIIMIMQSCKIPHPNQNPSFMGWPLIDHHQHPLYPTAPSPRNLLQIFQHPTLSITSKVAFQDVCGVKKKTFKLRTSIWLERLWKTLFWQTFEKALRAQLVQTREYLTADAANACKLLTFTRSFPQPN